MNRFTHTLSHHLTPRSANPTARSRLRLPLYYFATCLALALYAPSVRALPASGMRGMVATAHPEASKAGLEMLRAGGNAIDAAAAAAFALAVAEPYSSGIGGGGFALIKHAKGIAFFDFREVAPASSAPTMYQKADGTADAVASRDGGSSSAVPGAVAGYLEMQARFGKLTREKILAPAIRIAEEGMLVDERYRDFIGWRLNEMRADPEICRIFLVKQNNEYVAPPLGYRVLQPELAATLKAIARDGQNAFYQGSIAQKIVADMQTRGGRVTLDDLKNYRVRERAPLVGSYRGRAIVTSPPPSSGGQIMLTLLNIMETLPAGSAWHDPLVLHTYIEASKRAYADRALLGDPNYLPYLNALLPKLLAKDRAAVLAQLIQQEAHAARAEDVPAGQGAQLPFPVPALWPIKTTSKKERTETTHLTTLDADGLAVSLTTTINYAWGAAYVAKATGIVMNDEMDDFAIAPGVANVFGIVGSAANSVEPGKTPLSSMTPTMIFEGSDMSSPLRLVVGSPGGARIPSTVAQTIINYLDYEVDIGKAISLGRVHHQHLPDVTRIERLTLDPLTVDALKQRGHVFEEQRNWCNATAIAIDPKTGIRTAAADTRGIGTALAE